jgi:hypothetical protein
MRNANVLALVLSVLLLAPIAAHADSIGAGDLVTFTNRPGSPGGEFGLTAFNTPGGSAVDAFITFCLQKTEYIDFSSTFVVGGISNYAVTDPAEKGGGVGGQDQISPETAWLYTQFRTQNYGALSGIGYDGTATWANLLQNAIWYFEDELTASEKLGQASNPFIGAAKAAGWTDIGNVRVLNLFRYDPNQPGGLGSEAQDQLVLVPEPSTLVLLGSGVLALCVRRRRKNATR